MSDDVNLAIERYRTELVSEAELARADLDEIEDHLRALIDDLRERGLPHGEAIAEACRRLGDPRQVAREHARVRTAFGAKLSRWRAWSAAALLAPFAVWAVVNALSAGSGWFLTFEALLFAAMTTGVALRITWARALVLGMLPATVASCVAFGAIAEQLAAPIAIAQIAAFGGALAFVAPWRRDELGAPGLALALLAPVYFAAAFLFRLYLSMPGNVVLNNPWGTLGVVMAMAAIVGGITRGRWAAIAAAVAAVALVEMMLEIWPLTPKFPAHNDLARVVLLGQPMLGAICAAASALVLWRRARSALGTLRSLAG